MPQCMPEVGWNKRLGGLLICYAARQFLRNTDAVPARATRPVGPSYGARMRTPARRVPVADAVAGALAVALIAAAVGVGYWLNRHGARVWADPAPLYGMWLPHVGPGTPMAVAVAVLVVAYGPALAARLPWRPLLALGYLVAVAWTLSLAMIDGWSRGLTGRLVTEHEYVTEVPEVTGVLAMLRGFTARILDYQPDSWVTHVAGHPPGALLVFVALDRVGLGGGAWAAIVCVLAGASTAVTVPVTLRLLGARRAGRAAVPFLALFPGAVWFGASADAVFAAVTAAGIALLAWSAIRAPGRVGDLLAVAAGLTLGYALFLSYGFVLMAPLALAVALVTRRVRPLVVAAPAALAVVAAFAAGGFWWLDGYRLLVVRYNQGIAADRSYAYWGWANLALLLLSAGPAVAPMLRRVVVRAAGRRRRGSGEQGRGDGVARRWLPRERVPPALALPLASALAIAVADLSGMSKAEVERIWLPFAVWLHAAAVLLPWRSRRFWLAVQAATALAVNHLVLTLW